MYACVFGKMGDVVTITADRMGYRGIVTKAAKMMAYNVAISGATSADMMMYLKDHIAAFNPEIISVMIGTNDSFIIADEKNLVSTKEYSQNLDIILSIATKCGAKVLVSTIAPTDEKRLKSQNKSNNNGNIERYCDIIREKSKKHGVILNDFSKAAQYMPLTDIIEEDGTHLTPLGQAVFAENWLKCVADMEKDM